MAKPAPVPDGRTPIIRHVDESRLYRKIPLVRRLVPSLYRKIEQLIWPNGRTMRITPIRFVGIKADRIHLFGDSHTWVFRTMPEAEVHYREGHTMHRVGRDGIGIFGFSEITINPGEALGFIFGEIDIRAHIAKQRDKFNRTPDEIIETLVTKYIATLKEIAKLYPQSPIIIFSVVPPMGKTYPNFRRYKIDHPAAPDADRIVWTKQINGVLREQAAGARLGFLDQYTPFVNEKGMLNLDMTADGLHWTPNPVNADVQDLVCVFEDSPQP